MQAKLNTKALITPLIEQHKSDNNYTAYIPELRLGAVGDTVKESRENAIDLAIMERSRLPREKNLLVGLFWGTLITIPLWISIIGWIK